MVDKLEEVIMNSLKKGLELFKEEMGENDTIVYDKIVIKAITTSLCTFWDSYIENHNEIMEEFRNKYQRTIN